MEGKFSKVVFAVLALAVSSCVTSAVYAHTVGGFPNVVPCNQARFHVGLTGLYMRMSNDDLLYATQTSSGSVYKRHYADPEYSYGGRLDLGYLIPNTGNDLTVNYTMMSSDEDFRKSYSIAAFTIPDSYHVFQEANSKIEFDFHEINLEIGQKVDFCRLHTRFHFGLSYASLDHDYTIIGLRAASVNSETRKYTMELNGYGPRFGVDMTFPLTCASSNFGLIGQFAGSILYTDTCFSTSLYRDNDSAPNDSVKYKYDDEHTITPAGTMKIGLEYTTNSDPACGGISVAAGWQATGYYHSIVHGMVSDHQKRSNFVANGFFLTVAYTG